MPHEDKEIHHHITDIIKYAEYNTDSSESVFNNYLKIKEAKRQAYQLRLEVNQQNLSNKQINISDMPTVEGNITSVEKKINDYNNKINEVYCY